MSRRGIANLPLHGGKAPRWLFKRMVKLSRGIIDVIINELGRDDFILKISDPFWFQSLACVLAWDWHSSGATTVTCGALKEALNPEEHGISIVGGKGKTSRTTLNSIEEIGEFYNLSSSMIEKLKYSSRIVAKIDNSTIQDGYTLYHHSFLFTDQGKWSVIQQGMNTKSNYARRYHWLSDDIDCFFCDPHNAILGNRDHGSILNMVSEKSLSNQRLCVDLVKDNPRHLREDWANLTKPSYQKSLDELIFPDGVDKSFECLDMPRKINWNKMKEIYDFQPKNYEELVAMKGVGSNTIRALALISDLIYGEKPSWSDPVKYSFAVGGKDGVPYPVDRDAMDESIDVIKSGIEKALIGDRIKLDAIKRLHKFFIVNNQVS